MMAEAIAQFKEAVQVRKTRPFEAAKEISFPLSR